MTFDVAIDRVLSHEGGYTDGIGDPGGETNWGISKRSYPGLDIKTLTRDAAKGIYRIDFWDRIHADKLPAAVVFQILDFAINSGVETAVRYLQRAIGVADDGYWGPVSQNAIEKIAPLELVMRLLAERLDFMTRLSNWSSAGQGWVRRIAQDLRYGVTDAN
jgi:lysozyme family protein